MGIRDRLSRLVRPATPTARRTSSEALTHGTPVPRVSVIVPVYNVEEYLAECLDSVLDQTLKNLEVIAVDDGSTDGSGRILAEYAAKDSRLTVIRQENAGQGAARNAAIARARGEFLTFLDADDTVPRTAYRAMVTSLERSGSQFVVGQIRRLRNGHATVPPAFREVHSRNRIGITIDDFPQAMLDVIAGNRMIRRDFWNNRVGPWPTGMVYEDHVPGVAAYLRAESFDILREVTYLWRQRENETSTSQQKHDLGNLRDRIAAKAQAEQLVRAEGSPAVLSAWVARVVGSDFQPYIDMAEGSEEEYRRTLRDVLAHYLSIADRTALDGIRFLPRLRALIASQGRWDLVEPLDEFKSAWGPRPPAHVHDGRAFCSLDVAAHLGAATGTDVQIPHDFLDLGLLDTSFTGRLGGFAWTGPGAVELTGWAYARGVDLAGHAPTLTLWLAEAHSGRRVDLSPAPHHDSAITRTVTDRNADYTASGFRVTVDLNTLGLDDPALSAPDSPGADWVLHARVELDGLVREGAFHAVIPGSSARAGLSSRIMSSTTGDADLVVAPKVDPTHGFSLGVRPVLGRAVTLAQEGRRVQGTVTGPGNLADLWLLNQRTRRGLKLQVAPVGGADDTWTFAGDVPDSEWSDEWVLRHVQGPGDPRLVYTTASTSAAPASGSAPVVWGSDAALKTRLVPGGPGLAVTGATPETDSLTLRLQLQAITVDELTGAHGLRLVHPRATLPARGVRPLDGADAADAEVEFSLLAPAFGSAPQAVPTGTYALVWGPDERTVRVAGTLGLGEQGVIRALTGSHRVDVFRDHQGLIQVALAAPLADDEIGEYAQRQLTTWYQSDVHSVVEGVFFQSYLGEFATDSQRALSEHLRSTRPDMAQFWGVADSSTQVPEGTTPVVVGSRAWYAALASSRYLCSNIDFQPWFRKHPHQRYLQTFHGYPFKSMGRTFWEGRRFTPARITREIERRRREWDTIVVPSQDCVAMYRDEYDWTGETLVTGYPRSDRLVKAPAGERERILARLGIDSAKTVVLYAPTYRDQLTTKVYAAKRFDDLDLAHLTRVLGDSYVVLLRGHNNNQREDDRITGQARVLDVTDHPEINDLTLAADVAVLDYSSLRFDWALTGKPMVFFVPDRDTYFADRPPLFSFEESAPGPLLDTTDQVAAALQDLPALRAAWADATTAFNKRFNCLQDGEATRRVSEFFS